MIISIQLKNSYNKSFILNLAQNLNKNKNKKETKKQKKNKNIQPKYIIFLFQNSVIMRVALVSN